MTGELPEAPAPEVLRELELVAHRLELVARHLRELAHDVRRSPTALGAAELPAAREAVEVAIARLHRLVE